jgi:nickel transport protein
VNHRTQAAQRLKSIGGGFGRGLILLLMLAATPAMAHNVTVFAWVEGDTVHTESKFSGGRPAKGAAIAVFDSRGEKLLEDRTDEQGFFSFKAPRPEALRIVLTAGAGHRNEWRVAAQEFTGLSSADAAGSGALPPGSPSPDATAAPAGDNSITLNPGELQNLIEASLDKKLAPILQRLGQLGRGPTLSDVIGGIGYILGLVGLAAYLQARRRSG